MARDIKLDQIRARLGDLDKPRVYDPYGNEGDNQQDFDNDDGGEGEGSTLNAGFITTILGLFIAVSGGTYMFSEGINPFQFSNLSWGWKGSKTAVLMPSSADGECGKDWMTGYMNGDPMHCYLTKRINRLCNAEEKESLVARIQLFQDDYDTFDRNLNMSVVQMAVGTPLSDQMQIGLEAAKMDHAKTPEDAQRHENNVMEGVSKMLAGSNKVMEGQKYQNFGYSELESDLRSLGQKGYVSLSDFPSRNPKWVTSALQDVKVTAPACKK